MENDYVKTPIDGFGKKILASQGWFHGRGLGKQSQGEITPYANYTLRSERGGLGSDKELAKKILSGLVVGDTLEITQGKHQGICGTLISIEGEVGIIEIVNNSNPLKVPISYLQKPKNERISEVEEKIKPLKWIIPDVVVRVKNKYVHKGEIYGQKGIVEDVLSNSHFILNIKGKIYEDLHEKDLETVIPAIGKDVRIVRGAHQGEVCKLLSRDKRKNIVTLQLFHEIVCLKQDDICDFISHN